MCYIWLMATSTQRCRRYRARKRAGIETFMLRLPLNPLAETLVRADWLKAEDRDDVDRVHAALTVALLEWCGGAEA